MTTIAPVSGMQCIPLTGTGLGSPQSASAIPGLPPPLVDGTEPTDVLGMMMAAVERMSSMSGDETEKQIKANHAKLEKAMDDFMDKIAQAAEAARRASKKTKKGFFGKLAQSLGGICAKVIGASVDFLKDLVEAPFEIAYAVAKNCRNPLQAFKDALSDQFTELSTNGQWAKSIEQFTQGVIQFAADFADFALAYTYACARSGLTCDGAALASLKQEAMKMWESFSDNILANEGFWDVVEPLAKAAAVAGALATGGALGFLAIAAIMLLEVDCKTGFLEAAVGKEAAPFVRAGLAIGATALSMGAGGDAGKLAQYVGGTARTLGGVAMVDEARRDYLQAKTDKAEAMRDADLQEVLHRVKTLHELADDLVDAFSEVGEGRRAIHSSFQAISEAQCAAESATIIRA